MERIEEIRARMERLKTPHRVKIDVSGSVDISGIAAVYANSPSMIVALLAEVDRLQSQPAALVLHMQKTDALCAIIAAGEGGSEAAEAIRDAMDAPWLAMGEELQAVARAYSTMRNVTVSLQGEVDRLKAEAAAERELQNRAWSELADALGGEG